jgi:peptidoglycan hydrolase-like protein with peptidoglycan-binding domain
MQHRILWIFCLLALAVAAYGDERVRQVQEELRRRNLYFGDIDGKPTPELSNALRRYQSRKGFPPSGAIDDATAASLDLQPVNPVVAHPAMPLPDVPVLRSDSARQLPENKRVALEKAAEANPDPTQTPLPPAEAPAPPEQVMMPDKIQAYVEQYLRDSETDDIPAQTKYFDYPVDYFDHGTVNAAFVNKDVTNYVKRWPERKYTLLEAPKVIPSGKEGEAVVQFPINFDVRNSNHQAKGRTNNIWTVRQEGDDLKIVAIREQRVRD